MSKKEYIERDTAKKIFCRLCYYTGTGKCKICPVDTVPAANVVEVRTGEWEEVEIEDSEDVVNPPSLVTMRCNKCNRYHTTIYFYGNPTEMMHYCPNCGAKMDGERKGGDGDA